MPSERDRDGEARGPEAVAEELDGLGMRMHQINRIWRGEQGIDWHLAEVVRRVAALYAEALHSDETETLFGDGYGGGTLDDAAQRQWLIDRLLPTEDPKR